VSGAFRYRAPSAALEIPVDSHAVIEASAGTGKTYLLEHRVVHLLLHGDTQLERLLVVTFTERATAELRARIRGLIETLLGLDRDTAEPDEPHWLIDDVARSALRTALAGFDGAPIHTIHGFCQRVLTDNAFANRRLFDQRQVDRASAFHDAFMDAVRTDLSCDADLAPYLRAWLSVRRLRDLESLLFEVAERGDTVSPAFDEVATVASLRSLPLVPADGLERWLDSASAGLKLAGVHGATVKATRKKLADVVPIVASFHEHGDLLATLGALEQRTAEIRYLAEKLAPADGAGPQVADDSAAAEACALAGGLATSAISLGAVIAQRLGPPVAERLAAAKRRQGLFDFEDMLALVWSSLEGDRGPELCRALRTRYDFALIDEFQDTDEVQWNIFRRLFLDSDGRNRLSIIGDPKQAIYGFRGADVAAYLRARAEMLERGARRVALRDNYRSTEAVVGAYNAILDQGVPTDREGVGPFFSGEIRYDEPVTAASGLRAVAGDAAQEQDVAPAVVFEVAAPPPRAGKRPRKLKPDDLRLALLPAIAGECRALLSGQESVELVARSGERRALEASDIFVLTRSKSETAQVAERLRAEGVPCSLYKQDGLFQTPEAHEIRDLLAGIARPQSLPERLACWQTPFFAVPLAELVHARDLPETHPLIGRLLDWKQLADRQDYDALFESVVTDSGLARRELVLRSGERRLTNYRHMFELLLEDTRTMRRDLPELIERLDGYIDGVHVPPGQDGNVQRVDGDRSAVQVMTMHKSKGLEAAVVFLYGGFSKGSSDSTTSTFHLPDGRRAVHVGAAFGARREGIRREAEEEDQRLLYVALTRARARLYLPWVPEAAGSVSGAYKHVNRQLERVTGASRELFVRRVVEPQSAAASAPDSASDESAPADSARLASFSPSEVLADPTGPAAAAAAHQARRDDLRRARLGPIITSYTRLKHREASSMAVDADELKGSADAGGARPADDELPGGREAGIFLHHILEHLPGDSVADRPTFETWRQQPAVASLIGESLAAFDQPEASRAHVERMVYDCAAAPMEVAGALVPGLYTCVGQREVEFLYPLPKAADSMPAPTGDRADDNFVKGFIDYLFEHEGRLYAVDWKTDVLADYGDAALAAHAEEAYGIQARLYLLALARMVGATDERGLADRLGGIAFVFTRGLGDGDSDGERAPTAGVVSVVPRWDELARWQRQMGDQVERARLGVIR